MCKKYSAVFIITMVLAYAGLFTTTLLNMIFSIKASNKRNAFEEYYFPEFREKINRKFIMDLDFEEGAEDKDLYGEYRRDEIYKWRNNTMNKTYQSFEIELLKDVISYGDNCREGYKKCGSVNDLGDMLCLKLAENEHCPINDIKIDENGLKPSEDHKNYTLGDKYIYFSTEEKDKRILTNLSISEDYNSTTNLDSETLKELCKYNNDLWSGYSDSSKLVYLDGEFYSLPDKDIYEDLIKEYEKREKLYNSKITEMNNKVKNFKGGILFMGILTFVITAIIPIDIGTYYLFKNEDCKRQIERDRKNNECSNEPMLLCCIPCYGLLYCFFRYSCAPCFGRELNQKILSINLFIVFLPVLICSLINVIIGFIKRLTYNDYLAMELINDYKNGDSLGNSFTNINRVIILNIISLCIFVVYSLVSFVNNKLREEDSPKEAFLSPY